MDTYLQIFIAKWSKLISAYNKAIGLGGTTPTFLKRWGGATAPSLPASYTSAYLVESQVSLGFLRWFQRMYYEDFIENAFVQKFW